MAAIVFAASGSVVRAVEVRLQVQSRETGVGLPIRIDVLIVNAEGTPAIETPTVADVDIRAQSGVSRSSQVYWMNGNVSREETATYTYFATARKQGRFTIPPFIVKVDGQTLKTDAIQFIAVKSDAGDLLLVEVKGARDSLYVGEPLDVTLQIYIRPFSDRSLNVKLDEGDMWSLVDVNASEWGTFGDAIKNLYDQRRRPSGSEVLHPDSQGVERAYYLYEISDTFWPMSPGRLNVGATRINMQYPTRLGRDNSLFSRGLRIVGARPVSAIAEVAPISIQALPEANKPAIFRGAVGRFAISAKATPTDVAVGEPITLDLVIRGTGRLETLEPPPLPDIRELTDAFKVPNDPLAGVVSDGAKRFSQSIRARRDGITQIPSIPFAYFDPKREDYIIARTDPIPIKVKAADVLSATQIVDAVEKGDKTQSRSLRELQSGILANYTGTEALLSQGAFILGWGSVTLLGGPPVLVLAVFLMQRRRLRLRGDVRFARRRSARRKAMHALKAATSSPGAGSAAEIASALCNYVADRCNLPPGGLTRSEASEHLRDRGVGDELCRRVNGVLEQCEMMQFAGRNVAAIGDLAATAEKCIAALEREAIGQ